MSLQASFIWKNPDSTKDLNAHLNKIVRRGVVWGGLINPSASSLNIEIDPLVAVSFDGMVVNNADPQPVTVAAGTNNYLVVRARYNENGVPPAPTLHYQVLSETAYNIDPEKDYLIVLGRVELAPAATSVSSSDIYYDVRDEVTPQGRDWFRGAVAVPGDLPTPPPNMNKEGDFYFVQSANTFYFWNSTSWEPLNTGSFNSETTIMNKGVVDTEWKRIVDGSGVIAGVRPEQGNFASGTEITLEETPATPNQIGIDTFSAIVNGHFVETHGQYVSLDSPPGIGQRYDIVYLEVWREDLTPPAASPETVEYEKNPDGSTTYTIQQVDDKLESLSWYAGIPAVSGDNMSLHKVDAYNHGWRVVKYRITRAANLSSVALYNPSDPSVSALALNIDGNPFTSEPAGNGMDDRLWVSPAPTTSVDGYSWAIPLFVLKRDAAETYVQIFTGGVRTALPVYPVVDLAHAAKQAVDSLHSSSSVAFGLDKYPYDEPSGFLSGMDHEFSTVGAPNSLRLYDDQVKVRVRGVEDWIKLPGGPDMDLGVAPSSGYARTLVYLKMNFTLYDNATSGGSTVANSVVSQVHHPFVPSNISGTIRAQGWKRGFITWQFVYQTWSADYLDEDDAMTAAGWTRGDVTMASANAQYEDGGIWSRSIAIDADDRIHPMLAEWAVPVCLVHRRNSATWSYSNQNGTGSARPDNRKSALTLHPDDLVDLRHEVGLSEEDVKLRITNDIKKNMVGRLRTRLADKYIGSGTGGEVAGSRILQTDFIGNIPGEYNMEPGDGLRRIWSDAREFHVIAAQFKLKQDDHTHSQFDYTYDAPNNRGTLIIKAPAYASIVRHIPAIVVAQGESPALSSWLDFAGPPLWTSQHELPGIGPNIKPTPADAKYIDSTVSLYNLKSIPFYLAANNSSSATNFQGFLVTNTDTYGNATEMVGYVDTSLLSAGDEAVLSWWIHYDRSYTAPYDVNYGLSEIPDEIHKITKDPLGTPEELHAGPIYCVVKKTLSSATSVTISSADVTTASGLTGTVSLAGIGDYVFDNASPGIPSRTMTVARDAITVNFGSPYTGEAQFEVYFHTSDVNKWVEIGRGGKSVQAYFEYKEKSLSLGAQPAPFGNRTVTLDEDILVSAENPFGYKRTSTYWLWTKTTTATEWTYKEFAPAQEFTNFISFEQAGLDQEALLIVPVHKTLTSAPSDTVQLDYTYTPYQGLSSTGGKAATITPTAVQEMKDKLHGEIVDSSDFFITQNGAASYFSGVECWAGVPFNHHYSTFDASVAGARRFELYNKTGLVLSSVKGVPDLFGTFGSKNDCTAAAVLRMPFPSTFSMVGGSYHDGTMDFDLDPARAGSAAGEFTYAPAYPGGPTAINNAKLDQFVNGLSPLRFPGDDRRTSKTTSLLSSGWVPTDTDAGASTPQRSTGNWIFSGVALTRLSLVADLPDATNSLVQRVLNHRSGAVNANGLLISDNTNLANGVRVRGYANQADYPIASLEVASYLYDQSPGVNISYFATIPSITSGSSDWYVGYHPGTALMYYMTQREPTLLIGIEAGMRIAVNGDTLSIGETLVDASSDFSVGRETLIGYPLRVEYYQQMVDMVTIPYGTTSSALRENGGNSVTTGTAIRGLSSGYPTDWTAGTISALEGLYVASEDLRGAGRGLFLGTTTVRSNMSVLVPGSGTAMRDLPFAEVTTADPESEPTTIPYAPPVAPFASTNRVNLKFDHGGPIAYSCFGIAIRPNSNKHKNKLVLQITGGPIGATTADGLLDPSDLDGTAIDAFWPTGRPILKSKK